MRIAVTGASGLIGTALTASLRADGAEVLRLVRRPARAADEVCWDPSAPNGALNPGALEDVDGVVHLSGASVAERRWTPARKQELRASRVSSTSALVAGILAAPEPVPVLLCASAVGWYGDTGDRKVDEAAQSGRGFLADLVRDWEAAAASAATAGIRVASLRSGIVLSSRGGMLPRLLPSFRLGLGARIGSGDQYLSWITLADHVRAVRFVLDRDDLTGPVNLTAPTPVTNAQFTAALAAAVHKPALLRLPAGLLRLALGEMSGELLASCRAVPSRLDRAGFTFADSDISAAIRTAMNDAAAWPRDTAAGT